ncbi:hypothetical protein GQ53DRAFT_525245 [Thozetella sp. PMI_491]|nr:hypothetical protein GQ53DRAFT_525245 [Thozetella sp. PMI_491]
MPRKSSKVAPQLPTRFLPPRSSANRQGSFPRFLDMPLELRHITYSHLLVSPTSVDVWSAQTPEVPLTSCSCNRRLEVGILRTNKQIHAEATRYLYSTNTFTFMEPCDYHEYDPEAGSSENPVVSWLQKIGPGNSKHIRNIQLRIRTEREFEKYYSDLLQTFAKEIPNLTRIAIVAERHKSCKILRYDGPPGAGGSIEYDGEDTDDEESGEEVDDDMVLVWSQNLGMFIDRVPKVFKSYFVTAIPHRARPFLAEELQAFQQLGLIMLFGKNNKGSPDLKDFCAAACTKLAQCSIQETHATKLPRLTLPWGLEIANEYQWRNRGVHKVDRVPSKSKKGPVDEHAHGEDEDEDIGDIDIPGLEAHI